MKQRYCLLGLLLLTGPVYAQSTLRFDGVGRLTHAPAFIPTKEIAVGSDPVKGPDHFVPATKRVELDAGSRKAQATLRKAMVENAKATAAVLEDPTSETRKYYTWLWGAGTVATLAKQYQALAKRLAAVPASPPLIKQDELFELDTLLAARLDPAKQYYAVSVEPDPVSETTIKVELEDAGKDLLLSYYEILYKRKGNEAIATLNRTTRDRMLSQAGFRRNALGLTIDSLRRHLQASESFAKSLVLFNRSYDRHEAIQKLPLLALYSTPWMRTWLWRQPAAPQLNPLPFTDEANLTSLLQFDEKKGALYDRYVTRTVEQRIARDRKFDIASFTKDAHATGQAETLFTDSTAYKKARAENRRLRTESELTKVTANLVKIPWERPNCEYVRYTTSRLDDLATAQKLPVQPVDTRVVVSVHNLEKGHKLTLQRTQATVIKDQSATQIAINDGLDGLGAAVLGVGQVPAAVLKPSIQGNPGTLTRIAANKKMMGPIVSTTTKSRTGIYKSDKGQVVSDNKGRITEDQFWKLITDKVNFYSGNLPSVPNAPIPDRFRYLRLLEPPYAAGQQILDSVKVKYESSVVVGVALFSEPQLQALIQEITSDYLTRLTGAVGPRLLTSLREDSLYLQTTINLMDKSTLPPKKVERTLDKEAFYHTERAITSQTDSVMSYIYSLQTVKGTEKVAFGSLAYKTGKYHRLQFSAGLAYTAGRVKDPELTATNGRLIYRSSDAPMRLYAGLHYYPVGSGLFLQDPSFWGSRTTWLSRIYVLGGVGIPKPIDNLYLGLGYDCGPGIRLSGGVHFHGAKRYEVFNNTIVDEGKFYSRLPFVSLGIDPVSFVKAFNLFK